MDRLKQIGPKWSSLGNLASAKLVSSMYVWLIVVPLVAKLLSGIGDKVLASIAAVLAQNFVVVVKLAFHCCAEPPTSSLNEPPSFVATNTWAPWQLTSALPCHPPTSGGRYHPVWFQRAGLLSIR